MKTMYRLFVLIVLCFLILENQAYAQVLISDVSGEPHESAALEIRADDGGLLIPTIELSLVDNVVIATNISSPADGLLIFHNGQLNNGDPSGLPKGLWYFDESEIPGSGKWLIYSRIGSIYSTSIDNFGEMFEANELGSGTYLTLTNTHSIPWASASVGLLGPGFEFINGASVLTETGSSATADQLFITTGKAYYTVDISTTLITQTSGNNVTGQLFVNDIADSSVFFRYAFQTSDEYVNCATSGIIILDAMDKVDFRFISTTTGEGIYIEHLNMKLTKIGDYNP
jgi:hypothetical protein